MKRRVTTWVLSATVLTVAALVLFSTHYDTLHTPGVNGPASVTYPGISSNASHTHIHDATGVTPQYPQTPIPQSSPSVPSAKSVVKSSSLSLSRYQDTILDRDPDFGTPHFVRRRSEFLSPPAPNAAPDQIVSAFIQTNARTFTLAPSDLQPPNARRSRDYTTQHNGVQHLTWQQQEDGIDIYGATFALNLTRDNRIINVSSRALHIPEVRFHDTVKVNAQEATDRAQSHVEGERPREPLPSSVLNPPVPIWYPLDMLSVVKAWDMLVDADHETHRLIVRADTGEVVEDYNCTWALEPITLQVYTNDSPTPFSPGMSAPTNYTPPYADRQLLTLSALDTNASPQGWIPDGSNELEGNNVEAYVDLDDDDVADDSPVAGSPYRTFQPAFDPAQPATQYRDAARVQPFYAANLFHDRLYQLGFDEAAGNFQQNNFGRGGQGGDPMLVEVWNGYSMSQYNYARIVVLNDGNPPRMELGLWYADNPVFRDSAQDVEVIYHECAHGVSSRLIGNGYGLSTVQSRGMGEGWSDFMALSLLSEFGDDPDGCYPFGAYVRSALSNSYYYGIRRFPYCTDTNKAPQTLADTDPNQLSFPASVPINPYVTTLEADQVHRVGEIWCLALWECRAHLIEQYAFAANDMMLRLVVDGMKLTPVDPTFTQARDAILQADLVDYGGTNQLALWRGFAKRGLGYSATVPESHSTVGVQEAFDLPFDVDAQGAEVGGDGDGYVEPGEGGELTIVLSSHEMNLTNVTASLAVLSSNVTLTVSNAVLGTIASGGAATSAPPFAFTVDPAFPGFTDAVFMLRVESDKGWFEEPLYVRIGNPYDYPPEILDVAVTNVTETNAWVSWTTGIPADGLVDYGTTTNYGMSTPFDPAMRTNHLVELSGLLKGTEYHYRIVSAGTNGLVAVSGDQTFRTRARIYVNVNSTATQELGTIEAPFKTLQAAAEEAKATGDDLLVAWGTYTGTSSEGVLDLVGSGYDLTILGGYSSDFTVRDPDLYVTVIDGEKQRRGIRLDNGATLAISGVTITRGEHEWGGGVHVRKSTFLADECTFIGNASTNGINTAGGALHTALGSSVSLSSCIIIGNHATWGGGLYATSSDTTITLSACTLTENVGFTGGGLKLESASEGVVSDCMFIGNSCEADGGGISVSPFCEAILENSTVASNAVLTVTHPEYEGGGGVSVAGVSSTATLTMFNAIVYANQAAVGNDFHCGQQSEVHADYSCIGDIYGSLTSSNHLIRADPLFANPAAGDFHILYGSPCIDTGQPGYGGGTDMDGEPRPFGAAIDMGADEFTDTDTDRMADYWELTRFGVLTNSDGTADGDNDALDDFGEYMNQTDPYDADTDDDLALDGWEVSNGYNPLNRDMDGDGMWDGWEAIHALNAFTNDAALNPDGDPHDNLSEFTADTDPQDSNSVLQLLSIGESWGGIRLDWKGGREAVQYLETSPSLSPADWTPIYALPPPTPITNAVIVFGVTNPATFYRIRVER